MSTLIIFLSGCSNKAKEEEAQRLGFSSVSEMGTIQSKGFNTKKEYEDWTLNQTLKAYGCKDKDELEEAKKLLGNNNCQDLQKRNAEIEREKSAIINKEKYDMAEKCSILYNSALNASIILTKSYFNENRYDPQMAGAKDIVNLDLVAGMIITSEIHHNEGNKTNNDNDIKEFLRENFVGKNFTFGSLETTIKNWTSECNKYYGENVIKNLSNKLLEDKIGGYTHPFVMMYSIRGKYEKQNK